MKSLTTILIYKKIFKDLSLIKNLGTVHYPQVLFFVGFYASFGLKALATIS